MCTLKTTQILLIGILTCRTAASTIPEVTTTVFQSTNRAGQLFRSGSALTSDRRLPVTLTSIAFCLRFNSAMAGRRSSEIRSRILSITSDLAGKFRDSIHLEFRWPRSFFRVGDDVKMGREAAVG